MSPSHEDKNIFSYSCFQSPSTLIGAILAITTPFFGGNLKFEVVQL